ncbi:hypothetical protein [Streptomyces sp. NPDC002082]|uniref:hypothetical protein n=1 Tax=Streptomyces sp. NPDC002082 TaxID=3154772 RepID=UPI003334781D
MILILGLIILIIAAIVALMGIFGNTGAAHGIGTPGGDFSILGYHATGSTGSLFLSGIIVGAAALLGLTLVMIGARRSARRSSRARHERGASRREAAVIDRERDDLIQQRDEAPAETGVPVADTPRDRGRGWFGHRAAPR